MSSLYFEVISMEQFADITAHLAMINGTSVYQNQDSDLDFRMLVLGIMTAHFTASLFYCQTSVLPDSEDCALLLN